MTDKASMHDRLHSYTRNNLRHDLAAGATVAVVALPQSMAYAMLAGAPPAFGLYTSVVGCIVSALLGSSSQLVSGPTNATAIMFASTLAHHGGEFPLLPAIALYTFLIGAFKLAFGLLRLGNLASFISDSVVLGFMAGAGVLIAGNQVSAFLGLPMGGAATGSFYARMEQTVRLLPETHPASLVVGAATLVAILLMQRIHRRMPAMLLACAGAAACAWLFDLGGAGVRLTGDIGAIPRMIAVWSAVPTDFSMARALAPGALAVAVISCMETTAVVSAMAASTGQRVDVSREYAAQGLAGMLGAFSSNFVVSGSPVRTSLNHIAGARTRAASVFSGVIVAALVLAFGPMGEYIPVASLAAILMVGVWQMVGWRRLAFAMRAGPESAAVLLVTLAGTLLLRIDHALYVGIGLSMVFFVQQSSRNRVTVLVPTSERKFHTLAEHEVNDAAISGRIVMVNFIGAMFFASIREHLGEVRHILEMNPAVLIVRLRRVSSIDSTGLDTLNRVVDDAAARGIPVLICGVDRRMMRVLMRSGLADRVGAEHIVASQDLMFNSVERTLDLAEALVKSREAEGLADRADLAEQPGHIGEGE